MIINNQRPLEGKVGKFGNLSRNGCGVVALYNASVLLSKPAEELREYHAYIQKHPLRRTVFFGLLGIGPGTIKRYFRKQGYYARWHFRLKKIEPGAKAYISLYFFASKRGVGAHYQAATYDSAEVGVMATNPSGHYENFYQFKRRTKGVFLMMVMALY